MARTHNSIIVDPSVVAKWYLRDEDLLVEADRLYTDWVDGRVRLVAPGHFPFEVINAIVKAERRQRVTGERAQQAIKDFTDLLDSFIFIAPARIIEGGARLATSLGMGFFDACYLYVARREGCDFVTADAAAFSRIRTEPDVIWLGNY